MASHRILFSKGDTARFISHLDLMRTMQRAFFRAGITIRHTEGFHPHPYISIPLPLPLGFSSGCEVLEFGLLSGASTETLPEILTAALPQGIAVEQCYEGGRAFRHLTFVRYEIALEFQTAVALEAAEALKELLCRESLVITKRSKKAKSGQTQLDIIPLVKALEGITAQGNTLQMEILLQAQNPGLNPDLVLLALGTEYPHLAPSYSRCHRAAIFDEEMTPYR